MPIRAMHPLSAMRSIAENTPPESPIVPASLYEMAMLRHGSVGKNLLICAFRNTVLLPNSAENAPLVVLKLRRLTPSNPVSCASLPLIIESVTNVIGDDELAATIPWSVKGDASDVGEVGKGL